MYQHVQALLDAGKLLHVTLDDSTELFLEPGDTFDETSGFGYYIGSGNTCNFEWSEVIDVREER